MKTALTIAGSDSSGGAGIQADIKTMAANGVYAMSAITALTAQNTTGVSDIMEVTPKFLGEQIDSVFTDIRPGAVKIGMVASAQLISKIAEKLKEYDAKNVVVDPVMVATSGAKLISDDAIETLKTELMPLADLLTPNIPEAEVLADMKIGSEAEMEAAAGIIAWVLAFIFPLLTYFGVQGSFWTFINSINYVWSFVIGFVVYVLLMKTSLAGNSDVTEEEHEAFTERA